MSIIRNAPNTIVLGGSVIEVGDTAVSETVRPGHLVERWNSGGVWRWRKHTTAAGSAIKAVALNQAMINKGVDDDYAANDLAQVGIFSPGATAWMLIASGQNVSFGDKLESAGNGTLKAVTAGFPLFQALESPGAVVVQTRVRVEAL